MKMEKWDLYNAKREKSGITVCRGEIIPKGLYHLSVSAWIVNQQGQYLLSQRHPKKQYPLYWECTGGSVLSGETSLQGAIREVKEELGILLTPGSEKLIYQTRRISRFVKERMSQGRGGAIWLSSGSFAIVSIILLSICSSWSVTDNIKSFPILLTSFLLLMCISSSSVFCLIPYGTKISLVLFDFFSIKVC
jgi:hypothetical protein